MQVSVRTLDRVIVQYGVSLGSMPGCVTENLDQAAAATVRAALRQTSAGVTISKDHRAIAALKGAVTVMEATS